MIIFQKKDPFQSQTFKKNWFNGCDNESTVWCELYYVCILANKKAGSA